MKWGRRIAVTTLVCAGVLAIALLRTSSREPVYQGRTLSSWIDQYGTPLERIAFVSQEQTIYADIRKQDEARRAIQHIGTNALPALMEWIRYDEPLWRTRLIKFLTTRGSAPAFLQRPSLQKLAMGTARRHAYVAGWGFEALGPAAHPAAVELMELSASKSPTVRDHAVLAILYMQGQKALILAAGLTNSESTVRLRAAESIGLCSQRLPLAHPSVPDMDPAPAVPLLINALDDPDINVRRAVTNTLRIIGLRNAETAAPPVPNTVTD